MKAAFFYGPDKIRIENTCTNFSSEDYICLKTLSCSVCSYDVRTFRNGSFKVKPPVILGHEICAQTIDDFEGNGIKSNTRVSVYPVIPCLHCWYCDNKKFNLCSNLLELGSTVNGGFAEFVFVPKKLVDIGGLVPVPDNVSNEEASLIEPLACCINGINQIKHLDFGSVTILGDGPVGLMQMLLFKKFFPNIDVTVVGKVNNRLSSALELGANKIINISNSKNNQILLQLERIKKNYSPNLIFVSNNSPASIDMAFDIANKNGKIVFFSGIKDSSNSKSKALSLNPNDIHYNQISVYGSFSSTPVDLENSMKLIASEELSLKELVTNKFSLYEIEDALISAESLKGLKCVVNKF